MAHIKGNIFIERPIDIVFDEVADIRNEPTYNPNMISVELKTKDPIGKGAEFRAELRSRNEIVEMKITYTDFKKLDYIRSHSVSDNMVVNGGLTFSPLEDGTLMEWSWDVNLKGNLRLFSPLVAIMGQKQEQRIWQGLKEKLERQSKSDPNVA